VTMGCPLVLVVVAVHSPLFDLSIYLKETVALTIKILIERERKRN